VAPDQNDILKSPPRKRGIFCLKPFHAAVLLLLPVCVIAQPRASIAEATHNFGKVEKGVVLSHTFTLQNTGNAPLIVTAADVACSCTQVDFPKSPVAPGSSGAIAVTFNTASVYGRQDRVVLLHSNDPASPSKVRFKANVHR
jgi:hypothetical protein